MAHTKGQKSKARKSMWFAGVYTVRGVFFLRPDEGPIRGQLAPPSNIVATLMPRKPEKITSTSEGPFCEALAKSEVKSHIVDMLQSIEDRLLPLDTSNRAKLPYTSLFEPHTIIDTEGHIAPGHAVPSEYLPLSLQALLKNISKDLSDAAHLFVTTLR
jgi:hypothetical protein